MSATEELTQQDYIEALDQREIPAYESLQSELEAQHHGKWVVIRHEQLQGTYETFQEAAADASCRFGRGPYLIRQVGAPPFSLPASVAYRVLHG